MRRRLIHHTFRAVTGLCAAAACLVFGGIVWAIVRRGWPAVSWSFLTEQIKRVGAEGGIFYNLVGTGILVATALVVCMPFALGLALLHGIYLKDSRLRGATTVLLHLLNGVPSIVFGIAGMMVFVHWLGWGKSWLSGGILLGFMILPTVTVALAERMDRLPWRYVEAAAGLGLRRSQIIRSVILPQSMGGLVTGSLLGLARAAGETAPIMFTATIFSGATFPDGIRENPVLSLPYHIFILAQDSFDPDAGRNLWGAALTLLALVVVLSATALPARLKFHEEARF
ncbi:MAG: phosphate ABC transporter permease PstA [Verrucomicrobiales bacterium]|nr:phosphate ABC transporter permease PstA [Verrucomicrobiales bacterium]